MCDDVSAGLAQPWVRAVRRASTSRFDDLEDRLDPAVTTTELGVSGTPGWCRAVRVLQWVLFAAALAGAPLAGRAGRDVLPPAAGPADARLPRLPGPDPAPRPGRAGRRGAGPALPGADRASGPGRERAGPRRPCARRCPRCARSSWSSRWRPSWRRTARPGRACARRAPEPFRVHRPSITPPCRPQPCAGRRFRRTPRGGWTGLAHEQTRRKAHERVIRDAAGLGRGRRRPPRRGGHPVRVLPGRVDAALPPQRQLGRRPDVVVHRQLLARAGPERQGEPQDAATRSWCTAGSGSTCGSARTSPAR